MLLLTPPPPAFLLFQIDSTVAVTSVGIDKFVLIDRLAAHPSDGSGGVFLRLTIPTRSMALRACEVGANGEHELTVTCYSPLPPSPGAAAAVAVAGGASGVARSFSIVLSDGGAAQAVPGVALPSSQSQGLLFPIGMAGGGGGDAAMMG